METKYKDKPIIANDFLDVPVTFMNDFPVPLYYPARVIVNNNYVFTLYHATYGLYFYSEYEQLCARYNINLKELLKKREKSISSFRPNCIIYPKLLELSKNESVETIRFINKNVRVISWITMH